MYVKIHRQILDSSVANDYRVRRMFQDLLLLADWDGVVDVTHEGISRRLGVPLTECLWAIGKLLEPDLADRSGKKNGARLELIDPGRDWGWHIINYKHYRELRDEEQRRSYRRGYMRPYMREKRERERKAKAGQAIPERCEDDARTMDERCVNAEKLTKVNKSVNFDELTSAVDRRQPPPSAVDGLTKVNNPDSPSENVNSCKTLLTPVNPNKNKNNIKRESTLSKESVNFDELTKVNNPEDDVVSFAEAKRIIGQISEVAFNSPLRENQWQAKWDHQLDEAMPIKRANLELIDWFYRLPDHHEIFSVTRKRQSIAAVIENLVSEPQKIRSALKEIGCNEAPKPPAAPGVKLELLSDERARALKKLYPDSVIPPYWRDLDRFLQAEVEAEIKATLKEKGEKI